MDWTPDDWHVMVAIIGTITIVMTVIIIIGAINSKPYKIDECRPIESFRGIQYYQCGIWK